LEELSLDYVSEDFLNKGILTGNGDAPAAETSAQEEKE
jgi:hypothetical protein